MKVNKYIKGIIGIALVSLISAAGFAKPERVLRIFSRGEVIQEYNIRDIEYLQVDELIGAPENVTATVEGNSIVIGWEAINGATYNVYRSSDNNTYKEIASEILTTTYTDNRPLSGSNYYKVRAVVEGTESGFSNPAVATLPDTGLESRVYLGVEGFNESLYDYPVGRLDEESLAGYTDFINGLSMQNGTILYYAVDEALNTLQAAPLPNDVETVALVTFTDGLDQGSLGMTDRYEDKLDYLNDVSDRISSSTVSGKKIVSYTIGLRGSDVTDNALFDDNLKKLSNPSSNGKEVSAMSAVNAEFAAIAKTLSESNYVQKLTLRCPVVSNGAKIRFTLDGTSSSDNVGAARYYIEGTYNYRERALENIVYGGMECGSGTKVYGTQEGIFVTFDFENIRTNNNVLLKPANIREWEYVSSSSKWQINSEFDTENGAEIEVIRSSAAIMLVLDCSSSLKNDFSTVKSSAINFIDVLYKAISGSEVPTPGPDPTPSNTINGHEYVDLGLPSGLKWATCNVGASSPTESGDYFAWGETKPKSSYTSDNCATWNKGIGQISGNANYDAARANWGGTWRMPSDVEMDELKNKCSWTWTSKSGINGYVVKGPNGNEIFLPAAGYRSGTALYYTGSLGDYWSSAPSGAQLAYALGFGSGSLGVGDGFYRYYGQSVRPVSD